MASFNEDDFSSPEEVDEYIDENEDELSSHDKEELKGIKRDLETEKQQRIQKRRKWAKYGITGVLGLGLAVLVLGPLVQVALSPSTQQKGFNLENQPMMGNESAPVTIVEFGDYRCPVCNQFDQQVFPAVKNNFIDTGKAKFYFINYAFLDQYMPGDTSQTAAVAAECVYRQNETEFWEFHHAVYDNQKSESKDWATEDFMMQIARESTEGLDYGQLEQCLSNRETADAVNSDRRIGRVNGVSGTPTIFVNGEQLSGWGYTTIAQAVQQELAKTQE
ncbi:thioredoxin domain-containing protein [Candidatus Nanohaloarchaea archaeon]|nr:thioredoxin domain-containing protein [Candidatus Nanohaloarchaea archaeon]